MKKTFVSIYTLLLILLVFSACEDHRLEGMVDDHIYLLNTGIQIQELGRTEALNYELVVYKSGMGVAKSEAYVSIDPSVLEEYNKTSEKKYEMLPDACFNLEETDCIFMDETVSESVNLTLDGGAIYMLQGRLTTNYAIPLRLIPVSGVSVDSLKSTAIIVPKIK